MVSRSFSNRNWKLFQLKGMGVFVSVKSAVFKSGNQCWFSEDIQKAKRQKPLLRTHDLQSMSLFIQFS